MQLEDISSEIKKINHKYPMIDWGGCGTFSYFLSEKLDSEKIPNQIVYIPEKDTPENAYRCDVKFHHILVKVDDYLLDNHGVYKFSDDCELLPLEKEKLKDMLEDKKLWNNVFPYEQWTLLSYDILNLKLNG